jgi:hypothetical protein
VSVLLGSRRLGCRLQLSPHRRAAANHWRRPRASRLLSSLLCEKEFTAKRPAFSRPTPNERGRAAHISSGCCCCAVAAVMAPVVAVQAHCGTESRQANYSGSPATTHDDKFKHTGPSTALAVTFLADHPTGTCTLTWQRFLARGMRIFCCCCCCGTEGGAAAKQLPGKAGRRGQGWRRRNARRRL